MKESKIEVWLDDRLAGIMAETNRHRYSDSIDRRPDCIFSVKRDSMEHSADEIE